MPISLDEVRHVARLARLDLDEKELAVFQGELNSLLVHFQDLDGADLRGYLPKPHAVALSNVMADDVALAGLTREAALSNAARSRAGLFIVPTIIEE
ncbi:MAG: Asp-tRNA(Asn)/Glu-tRNA(Gln) amidotransferase subunit GatC [Fimbriimonadaceae bacterium]|nr:Asp-tRNA(Asn)/Glu-tRNA(Gln) amidotransferase subunit GatC [Fimbriimonadaceae bacterium]